MPSPLPEQPRSLSSSKGSILSRMTITFGTVALDAADIKGLASFYMRILGWEVRDGADDDWITIADPANPDAAHISFQLAPDHVAPTWPDNTVPQQLHIDFYVDDIEASEKDVLAAGGRSTGMPGDPSLNFRVYLDPAGHPFCLCWH
jgi:predicted enzyme related to lactoylglutathione lyase